MTYCVPMADVTIFHNPNCSTSKFAVAAAEEASVDAEIELYLKTKPGVAEITALAAKLEDPPADMVRKDKFFADQGLDEADYQTVAQVAELIAEHPRLLQRPILVKGDRAIIGRPKDRVAPFLES